MQKKLAKDIFTLNKKEESRILNIKYSVSEPGIFRLNRLFRMVSTDIQDIQRAVAVPSI
jgi:hypothetical protein